MLTNLSIKNFALIDSLNVSFLDDFSIITGETGAGKSILLGGLGLLLGKRADVSMVNDTAVKCIVEGEFTISSYNLKTVFKTHDLEYDDVTIIRREILPSGKSRAFINDSPVSLQVLSKVTTCLIDIHSQHQTLQLTDTAFQFEVVDALAKNDKPLAAYSLALKDYQNANKKLTALLEQQSNSNETEDYNTFLLNELVAAKLSTVHIDDITQELEQLNNVETIQQQLLQANQLFNNDEIGVLHTLSELKSTLRNISTYSPEYDALFERIQSAQIELEDVFVAVEQEQQSVEANPERQQELTDTVNRIQTLFQKHKVDTIEALILLEEELTLSVAAVENIAEIIAEQEQHLASCKSKLLEKAEIISANRTKAIPKLTKQLEKILVNLGMENAKFNIQLTPSDIPLNNGKDILQFLFTANKGGEFKLLKKAASGGELSRIMLAIKAILSKYKQLPTIMFDEIDTGVSGDIANKMGLLMQYMSENMQVFSITHLSQIASKGKGHFKVYKEDINGKTVSNLKKLNHQERITEIAEMIGGKQLSSTAIQHAKELLETE